ncbi:MAG TPA: hypothetical protein VG148_04000 [Pyrinomonadaceae bacterium]|nr:hypothetical protein [Pyrinomonadaceae bacterium]
MLVPRTKFRLVSKLLVLLVMIAVAAFAVIREQGVCARPCHEVEHYYYSDATHSTLVGTRFYYCNGTYFWGTTSPYVFTVDGDDCGCYDEFP